VHDLSFDAWVNIHPDEFSVFKRTSQWGHPNAQRMNSEGNEKEKSRLRVGREEIGFDQVCDHERNM
jgi:hypothetical protein